MIFEGLKRPDLFIFDCDGVLIDSEIIASRIEAQVANELGHPITAQEICEKYMGMPHRILWEAIFQELQRPMPNDFMKIQRQRLIDAFQSELKPIDKVSKVLEEIGRQKCVASSTNKTQLIENLKTTNLYHFFGEAIFSVSEVEKPKPHPDIFLYSAKKMGFKPKDCLVIEDSVPGVCAAISAGMNVIGFLGGAHITHNHGNALLENGAIAVFENFEEILTLYDSHCIIVNRFSMYWNKTKNSFPI